MASKDRTPKQTKAPLDYGGLDPKLMKVRLTETHNFIPNAWMEVLVSREQDPQKS